MNSPRHGDWQNAKIFVPDGHHLRPARDSSGVVRTLLFENNTNKMVGPPVALLDPPIRESKHSGSEPSAISDSTRTGEFLSELLAVALIAAGSAVVEVGTPLFLDWWSERAWPAIKLRWSKWRSETSDTADSTEDPVSERVVVRDDEAVSSTPQVAATSMTTAEAHARRIAMLAALRFLVEQWHALKDAQIIGGPASVEAGGPYEGLTSEQILAGVQAILESSQALIDEDTETVLQEALRELPAGSDSGLPLRLTTGEENTGSTPS